MQIAPILQNDPIIRSLGCFSDSDSTDKIVHLKARQSQQSSTFLLLWQAPNLPPQAIDEIAGLIISEAQFHKGLGLGTVGSLSNAWENSALAEGPCEKHLDAWREKSQFTASSGNLSICSHLQVRSLTQWALVRNSVQRQKISSRRWKTERKAEMSDHTERNVVVPDIRLHLRCLPKPESSEAFLWPDFRRAKHSLSAGCGLCCRLMLKQQLEHRKKNS